MSHSKHLLVWFPAPFMYKRIRKRENYGSGELGTGVVQRFGKGPEIVISLVHSTLPQLEDRFLILISFYAW